MRLALIDNYDSFTYNLFHYIEPFVSKIEVFRNDEVELDYLKNFNAIIISPGPGLPSDVPLLKRIIETYDKTTAILGICLGHQAIAEAYGGSLFNMTTVLHGMQHRTKIIGNNEPIFAGLDNEFLSGHYHSWAVSDENFPACLTITSVNEHGLIMSLSHKVFNVKGIQFHPESVLTPKGITIIENWIRTIK